MRRAVLLPTVEIVAQAFEHLDAGIPLAGFVEIALQAAIVHSAGAVGNLLHQVHQRRPQRRKHRRDFGRLHAWLEAVKQRIIDRIVGGEEFDVFPAHGDDALQVRAEKGEVGRWLGLLPHTRGSRTDACEFAHPGRRNAALAVVLAPGHSHQSRVIRIGIIRARLASGCLKQIAGSL